MKRKDDFVTNSSSVSFCGYGAYVGLTDLKITLKGLMIEIDPNYDEENIDDGDFLELLDQILSKEKLTYLSNYDDGSAYIGAEFHNAAMSETLQDIKERVENVFRKLGIREQVGFIEESWRDG